MTAQPPKDPTSKETLAALGILSTINRLTLKTFTVKTRNELVFLILNDTVQVTRYDRAVLWGFDHQTPKLLGVSGQSSINATTDIAKRWKSLIRDLKEPDKIQVLTPERFNEKQELLKEYTETATHPSILWFPIQSHGRMTLGLWLERWEGNPWSNQDAEILNFLIQAYGLAWEKFSRRRSWSHLKARAAWLAGLTSLLLLFLIRVPLRIVAPCEIVPKEPILITAPLEDIIDHIDVKPGQIVHQGEVLFDYDKRVALQTLKVAENQVQVAQEDLTRAKTLAFRDDKALAEVTVLTAKLKKEQANLELAKYKASQLIVKAPADGIAMLENPDEWRGKPVKVGEKVLMVINPDQTKIRLWIPENDNIALNLKQPIKILLNVSPTVTREAILDFISNTSSVTDKRVVSFMAEAEWVEPQSDIKVGLKGTAILYGEKVSFFYWIMRKPWASFRDFVGF